MCLAGVHAGIGNEPLGYESLSWVNAKIDVEILICALSKPSQQPQQLKS